MNETLTLTKIHNSINRADRDVVQWKYVPGQSLAEIHATMPTGVTFAVSLNGIVVPEERLIEVFPCAGDCILFVPIIGGADGKQIGRIIGMIVVVAVAMYLTGPLGAGFMQGALGASATGSAFASGLIAGGLMVAGGLLVNAVLPPPKPSTPALGNNFNNSNAYSWSPQSLQQQGVPVPRWYGTNKLYGNIIGGYIESDGDKQYINALIDLGIGPFSKIAHADMMVNDQPVANFSMVETPVRYGWLNQDAIPNFKTTIVEHALSQKVTVVNSPYTYTPAGTAFDGLEVEVTFPQGLYKINQQTGAFESQSVDLKVEITNGTDSHILTSESNNVTYQDIKRWSLGKWIDIQSFATNPNVIVGKAWVETTAGDTDYSYYYDGGGIGDAAGYIPYHIEGDVDATTGLTWHYFGNKDSVTYSPESVPWSSGQTLYSTVVSSSQKVVRRIWRVFGLAHGTWNVKVTRITADNSLSTISNDLYLSAVREMVMTPFQYSRHALVGIRSLATDTLSGSLRFSVIADCLVVRIWNGSAWVINFSNNPAWVLFDVLTQPVYSGSGTEADPYVVIRYDGINPSRLDVVKFKEWADYCDELVPSGVGVETEKRITFNGGFDAETNLWDAAMTVCQIGGAILVWNGVKLTLAIDKPSDPVQLFSVGNTGVDSFTETFVSMEDRAAEIEVDFTNSANDYKRDKVTITNANIKTISSKVGLQMVGVTKVSEAWRIAKKRLLYNELITRNVSWKADIDAIACTVGDVVLLQSDVPQWGLGGRIVSATTTSVVLDQIVTIAAATSYSILIRLGSDTIVERTISNAPGTTNTLTVTSAFETVPSPYDVYTFGISNQESKPFRISSIQKSGDLEATISAVEYNVNIYNDEGDPVIPVPNYSQLKTWPTFSGLVLTEGVEKLAGGGVSNVVNVDYDNISDASTWPKVELLVSEAGAAFVSKGVFIINELAYFTVSQGLSYRVVVRAINSIGEFQPVSSGISGVITTTGQDTVPSDIASFTATFVGNLFKLVWTPNTEYDLDYYEIRSGSSWGTGVTLQAEWSGNSYEYRPTASGAVAFWIKAFDTSGNESATAATASATAPTADVPTAIVPISQLLEIDLDITFDMSRQDTQYVEIHAASTNDRNSASWIGTAKEKRWKHRDLNNATIRYYWVRIVNVFGETGAWYPSGINAGVQGSTMSNPTAMLQLLNADVTSDSANAYLAGETSLINILDTRNMLFELGVVGPGIAATYTEAIAQASSEMNKNKTLLTTLNGMVSGLLAPAAYDAGTAYVVGNLVTGSDTLIYQCILASTGDSPPNATYWQSISDFATLISDIQTNLDAATATWTSTASTLTADIAALAGSPSGRVTIAETNITQNSTDITLQGTSITGPLAFVAGAVVESGVQIESVTDVLPLEIEVSKTRINMDTANSAITLQAGRISGAEGRLSSAEIAIDGANAAINLRATSADLSGQVDILSDLIGLKLNATGTVGPGIAISWTDGSHTRSNITLLTDTLAIAKPDGTGSKNVFSVGTVGGVSSVGINGNLIVDETITATTIGANQIITDSANIADAVITSAHIQDLTVDSLQIANNAVTVAIDATLSDFTNTSVLQQWYTVSLVVDSNTVNKPHYFSFYAQCDTSQAFITIYFRNNTNTANDKAILVPMITSYGNFNALIATGGYTPTTEGTHNIIIFGSPLSTAHFTNGNFFIQVAKK